MNTVKSITLARLWDPQILAHFTHLPFPKYDARYIAYWTQVNLDNVSKDKGFLFDSDSEPWVCQGKKLSVVSAVCPSLALPFKCGDSGESGWSK